MGPNLGQPTTLVVLRFDASVAGAVRERVHHRSQRIDELPDGALRMELEVCNDWWLHNWILGYGPLVTVEHPPELVRAIVDELERARGQYTRSALDDGPVSPAMMQWGFQSTLPFSS